LRRKEKGKEMIEKEGKEGKEGKKKRKEKNK